MTQLNTTFAGLTLRNPVIVSSSGLTDSVPKVVNLQEKGAGAVVLKSIFEEQILYESGKLLGSSDYPEAEDYIRYYNKSNKLDEYLELIEGARKSVDIPVIASVNCISASEWTDFSKSIEEAGADALELNVYFIPVKEEKPSQEYEQLYLDLLTGIKQKIKIPVIIKLGPNFTSLVNFARQLYHRGADGLVLFNRFYSPDINTGTLKMTASGVFSSPADLRIPLRWVAILSGVLDQVELAASTGVHDGDAVIKQLLAGARAVQVCSVLYQKGPGQLTGMIHALREWMDKKGYRSVEDFRGIMSYQRIEDPAVYERAQFMRYFSSKH